MKKSIGVVLCRFQPMHLGHLHLINHALENNPIVLVIIGSADKCNERNPFSGGFRMECVTKTLEQHLSKEDDDRTLVGTLADYTDESDNSNAWGDYLYKNIRWAIATQEDWAKYADAPINIHYSDDINIIKQWFRPELDINVVHFDRSNIHEGVSSTKLRKMISEWDGSSMDPFVTLMPRGMIDFLPMLKCILDSYEH